MDPEIIDLIHAMNAVDGEIYTASSCCGHGKEPVRIWFKCHNLRYLPRLLYWFDSCHNGLSTWPVTVTTDCAMQFPTFCVESPNVGEDAYKDGKEIAALLIKNLED